MSKTSKIVFESIYLLWMGLLPVISSVGLGYLALSNPDFFLSLNTKELLIFWILVVFILGLALCPTTFMALFSGYIWSNSALIPLIISYALAATLGFFLAKTIRGDALLNLLKSKFKLDGFMSKVKSDSFSWVFLARLSPIFPFAITNAIMAFLQVRFLQFFVAGTLGMLPRTILAWWTGSQAKSWKNVLNHPDQLQWQDLTSFALLIFSAIGMIYLGRKSNKAN